MPINKVSSSAMAAAAALLFSAALANVAGAEEAKVQCDGVNACKGTSECASKSNSCQGMNACKGQGWVMLTKAACEAAKAKAKS